MDVAGALTAARRRREAETRLMREGLDVWRCKQQQLLAKKAHEQKQLREMLITYSPWGRPGGGAPNSDTIRKRKALQLDTLYGAPPSTSPGASPSSSTSSPTAGAGARVGAGLHNGNLHGSGCHTLPRLQTRHGQLGGQGQPQGRRLRCDPLLLFQFQEADRRAVDNLLRYRTDPRQQEQYRRDLDRMVQEKRQRQQQQQQKQQQQHQRQQHLEKQQLLQQQQQQQQQQDDPGQESVARRRRSAASNAEQPQRDKNWAGVELVPLLDRRRYPSAPDDPLSPTPRPRAGQGRQGAHLPTTDVTNVTKVKEDVSQEKEQTWRDLAAQIDRKRRTMEASRAEEQERSRQHFETWQMLWGRPGHGAPRDVKVKENLDVILYHMDRGTTAPSAAAAGAPAASPMPSPRLSPRAAATIEPLAQSLPPAAPAVAAR
ncbi:hypothetical protein FOCC_FOCC012000 [Frankliniella occidentalis]|uniref:Uncharacterized protein n=1 Tax=Frankliniella occidentalis TaxID=133901 RepID=A0A6J1SMI7_FRAOC|nr:putative uncharacterized protein DDB_G0271606 [Frankliniella occidentalis]KAE8742446.1 hypothetical protein FOCC_FOCC012000 [Frankliniella occidentalis]